MFAPFLTSLPLCVCLSRGCDARVHITNCAARLLVTRANTAVLSLRLILPKKTCPSQHIPLKVKNVRIHCYFLISKVIYSVIEHMGSCKVK